MRRSLLAVVVIGLMAGCGDENVVAPKSFTIGGTVTGLVGSGLVLQNNAGDDLAVAADGSFTFATKVAKGGGYAVTVLSQPTAPGQTCTVANGTGTASGAVTDVAVTCSTDLHSIGGTVTGLVGSGLVLQNSGGDDLAIAQDGAFVFPVKVESGATYAVTVLSQPTAPSQTCVVEAGAGEATADVTGVKVTCATDTYAIGGTVTGLVGSGLVLQDNGGDNLPISADGSFAFATRVASGSPFAVTVLAQPTSPTQTCVVVGGEGTVADADIGSVAIECTTNTYAVGGTVTGLVGSGLILQNNGGDDLAVAADGAFAFATPVASGASFTVTVLAQPSEPTQTCVVAGGSGTVVAGEVTSVSINCATNRYSVGGTVSGLAGSGLVLQNNLGDDLEISANGSFAFSAPVESGTAFAVTVKSQPQSPWQTCSVSAGEGSVVASDVTTVTVSCETNAYAIRGTVTGLAGAGLVLQNNLGDNLPVAGDGEFAFAAPILSGGTYSVTVLSQPTSPWQTCVVTEATGTVADADVTSVAISCATDTFTIGGTVTGLLGSGLVLQNNAGDDLVVDADGPFTFATPIASMEGFEVAVLAQPTSPWQTCTVSGGSGSVGGAAVTSVTVNCSVDQFAIGGSVSGLAGSGLTLRLNGGEPLAVSANGGFAFPTLLDSGAAYEVAIGAQPTTPWQTCEVVAGGTGSVEGSDIADVQVVCVTDEYLVGGSVSGLAGSGLALQINEGEVLQIAGDGSFAFPTPIASGAAYVVSVAVQPTSPWQTCSVATGSGTVGGGDVDNVAVTCVTNTYAVGGTVSGLAGTLVLANNGSDSLTLTANGDFQFAVPVESLGSYEVTIETQPATPSQTCTVEQGSGSVSDAEVASVVVTCVTNTFAVGGTVSGLAGSGLVLQVNGGDDLEISGNGGFTFPTPIASGEAFLVSVLSNPTAPWQTCSVSGGEGTVGGSDVSSVVVNCATNAYTVGGSVSGLAGTGLVLRNINGEELALSGDGDFAFPTALESGASYAVSIKTQPTSPWQTCVLSGESGVVAGSNVTSLSVACTTNRYAVKVQVSGLAGSGLVLQDNGADNLAIGANGTFTFATRVASGAGYAVTVLTQPGSPSQTCAVASPNGTIAGADVTLAVSCTTNTFTIGGTVSGLAGSGLSLLNNGGDRLTVAANGAFTFATRIASGAAYAVTVASTPGNQQCTVTSGSGTVGSANVTSVAVHCVTHTTLMVCGSSSRSVATFIPSGLSFTVVSSCTPDSATQALLITRYGSIGTAALQSYVNAGGIVLTEYNISHTVFGQLFGAVSQGSRYGACQDTAPTVAQLTPGDPFWQANAFHGITNEQSGCGYSVGHFPGLTPIAGWSASAVSIGYRNYGLGRLWVTDFDWQDNEQQQPYAYTNQLMGYMITHRR